MISINFRVHKQGYGDRGSSYLPLPPNIANTKGCINVRNEDNECFKYAMLAKFLTNGSRVNNPSKAKYEAVLHRYNWDGITYPCQLMISNVLNRKTKHKSVNVFGLDKKNNIYPLKTCTPTFRY